MRRVSLLVLMVAFLTPLGAQRAAVSNKPDTPFKLATFEAAGKTRVGLVLGNRIFDIAGANAELTQKAGVPAVRIPAEMRELVEEYARVSARLYQLANYFKEARTPWKSQYCSGTGSPRSAVTAVCTTTAFVAAST